jgi:hypothetical protein
MKTIAEAQRHGVGCDCKKCYGDYRAAAGSGKYDKECATCEAKSMHHNSMRQKHDSKVWGHDGGPVLSIEQKAQHLMAAKAHEKASHHFGQAARAYQEERPKAAKEHEAFGEDHADKAQKLTDKCDM